MSIETIDVRSSVLPAVQHGAGVGEADEHVRRGRGAVQPVQLVPYVVRGHGEESKDLRGGKIKLRLQRRDLKMKSSFCSFSLSLKLFVLSPSGAKEERRMQD